MATGAIDPARDLVEINAETIELIKKKDSGDGAKVINLIKSIEKTAEEESDDPFLVAMAERAKVVQENYEDRQASAPTRWPNCSSKSRGTSNGRRNRPRRDSMD